MVAGYVPTPPWLMLRVWVRVGLELALYSFKEGVGGDVARNQA